MIKLRIDCQFQFWKFINTAKNIYKWDSFITCDNAFSTEETHPAFRLSPVCRGQLVWRGLIFFYDRPSTLSSNAPAFRGQSRLSGFCCANRLCVRSPCHHNSRMRTFDENSCAISITSPRSLFHPRTQQVWWDHREKSRRASTLWDCRGKSRLPGKVPANGTWCEHRDRKGHVLFQNQEISNKPSDISWLLIWVFGCDGRSICIVFCNPFCSKGVSNLGGFLQMLQGNGFETNERFGRGITSTFWCLVYTRCNGTKREKL